MSKNIGNLGLDYFNRYRKLYLGIATYVSIIAFFVTIYGCMALSDNNSIVRRTYWTGVTGSNFTGTHTNTNTNTHTNTHTDDTYTHTGPQPDSHYSIYVGLTTFIYTNCSFIPGWNIYPHYCDETKVSFTRYAVIQSFLINKPVYENRFLH
jgi:hypothetical protein